MIIIFSNIEGLIITGIIYGVGFILVTKLCKVIFSGNDKMSKCNSNTIHLNSKQNNK